ncbi:emerin (Emery-Dreifuss muscular dystrophy) [Corythoichthys intestinalis]|uniref:emerin (Emery-Dreifuss muscular dystrophy) n=1 Tax=Corythoichthys intestinalis TaxID=161448 RepID=UPI0025A63861|nr:emerin (Emery-Dreifuss muscular dystrophy) [Corythoichthys intestinalis]
MSLSGKTDEELSKLLSKYGIKHGPIVDSTRKLYVKKLEKAMEDEPVTPSSDKTYYREEEEEITYVTYRSPVKHEAYEDMLKRRYNSELNEDEESNGEEEPIQRRSRAVNRNAVHPKEAGKSGCSLWGVIKMLLLLAVLAAAYYTYCHMTKDENPFKLQ